MAYEETKMTTGSAVMDWLLDGGYEKDVITTIYGPAGTGKTNLCLLCLARNASKKIIYIDTEGGFSVARLKQITEAYEETLKNVIVLKPTDFFEQKKVFDKLKSIMSTRIGLIIVDSVAMLYRLEVGKDKDIHKVNKELGVQLAYLIQIARKFRIPILITNQVYADFEDKNKVNMVGGDILKYGSKCLIELQKVDGHRKAIIRKHRSIPEGREILFKITDSGLEEFAQN